MRFVACPLAARPVADRGTTEHKVGHPGRLEQRGIDARGIHRSRHEVKREGADPIASRVVQRFEPGPPGCVEIEVAASSTCGSSCSSAFSNVHRVDGTEMLIAPIGRPWWSVMAAATEMSPTTTWFCTIA